MSARAKWAIAASLVLACSTAPVTPTLPSSEGVRARLEEARHRADAAPADLALQAQAGWLEYLVASDPEAALRRFDAVLSGAAATPELRALSLAGRAEVLEDRLQLIEAAQAYAELLNAAPMSNLAELAGERLLEAEGDSRAIDSLILEAAAKLAKGGQARGARLVREAAAHVASSRAFSGQGASESEAWAAAGAVQRVRVAGPFAAERLLELDRPTSLDGPELVRAPERGPAGSTAERTLEFPDGDIGLDQEPADGDLYYAASDLDVAHGGDYLLWLEGAGAIEARLDGAVAISRSPWPREEPRAQAQPVHLTAGHHALLVRWSRAEGPRFRLSLARSDGQASDIASAAPQQLSGQRLKSACALGVPCTAAPAFADDGGLRGEAERRLERDPADPIAAFLLVRSTLKDDRDVARAAVARLLSVTNDGAPALALRVAQALNDDDVPERIGRAGALADLAAAISKDPRLLRSALTLAAMQRDAERVDEAAQALAHAESRARSMAGPDAPLPPRLVVARARLLDTQGNGTLARMLAEAARARDGGRCDALALSQELSRREGNLADQKTLAEALLACPEQRGAVPLILRDRGELARSEELLQRFAALRPAQPQRLVQLAEIQAARKNLTGAVETMRRASAIAPRAADPWRQIAAWLDLAGDGKGALAAREQALLLLPGDMQVRLQVALARGERLLSWGDRDGRALAMKAVAAPPDDSQQRPAALRLLDYGGVEFAADGTAVERVHTVVRVLDKTGIARYGEVQIPADAELLQLRTIKPDGRTLEPEAIAEKDSHSLPGLEPGDAIETDYLHVLAPRGPELPGNALGAFFFVDDDTPMVESTYEVRAPVGLALEVDSHRLPPQTIERTSAGLRYRHSETSVAAVHPEPNQPTEEEMAPWVQIGTGARPEAVPRSIADWLLLRARPTAAIDELAAKAGGATAREKVERVIAAVSAEVRGRSNTADFSTAAQHVLALGRGNRLLLVKTALASAGIRSHLALVRPFGAFPGELRFPRGDLYSFAVLRIDVQPGIDAPIWLDSTWRLGPVGILPSFARGQDALIIPEPGEPDAKVRTPDGDGSTDGRSLSFELTLTADGLAQGKGLDEVRGFEAASLREALEQLDAPARRQAVEQMLARALPEAALDGLTVDGESAQGGKSSLGYTLHAQLGRPEGSGLLLPASMLPAHLARRYGDRAERKKTLLIQLLERSAVHASVALPAGLHLRKEPGPQELRTPFGQYKWSAKEEGGRLVVSEELSLSMQRVSPADYPAFLSFVREIDRVQGQELLLSP